MKLMSVSCLAAAFAFAIPSLRADVLLWTGAGDGVSWGDGYNWRGNRTPTSVDTAVFTDEYPVNGQSVVVSGNQYVHTLKFSCLKPVAITADAQAGGVLHLHDLVREDVEGEEGVQQLTCPLSLFAIGADTVCEWTVAGWNNLLVNAPNITVDNPGLTLRKLGSGELHLNFSKAMMRDFTNGVWQVREGILRGKSDSWLAGTATVEVGGGDTVATCYSENNGYSICDWRSVTVLSNGVFDVARLDGKWRLKDLHVYAGGVARVQNCCDVYPVFDGGTIEAKDGGDYLLSQSDIADPVKFLVNASDTTAHFDLKYQTKDGADTPIAVSDGEAAVDLRMSKDIVGSAGGRVVKSGAGLVKHTGKFLADANLVIGAGTWLWDGNGVGAGLVSISAGATLGGIGTMPVNKTSGFVCVYVNGNDGNPGWIAPGSVDDTDGSHVYGTLNLGSSRGDLSLLAHGAVKVRIGVVDGVTKCDSLVVNGYTHFSSDNKLVVEADRYAQLAVGTYTIFNSTWGMSSANGFARYELPHLTHNRLSIEKNGNKIQLKVERCGGMMILLR